MTPRRFSSRTMTFLFALAQSALVLGCSDDGGSNASGGDGSSAGAGGANGVGGTKGVGGANGIAGSVAHGGAGHGGAAGSSAAGASGGSGAAGSNAAGASGASGHGAGGSTSAGGGGTGGATGGSAGNGIGGSGPGGMPSSGGSAGIGGASGGAPSGGASGSGGSSAPDASQLCAPVAPGDHETYHLPATTGLPAGVTSSIDWAGVATSGGWYGLQIMDACRMHPDGFVTAHGSAAVRVEVDPGDDPLALGANSERAEALTLQKEDGTQVLEDASSGVQYYALGYYFPVGWGGTQLPWSAFETGSVDCSTGNQEQCNSWSFVMQFHGDSIAWGGLIAAQTTVAGPEHYELSLGGQSYPLSDGGAIALGQWTDFVLKRDWGTGATALWRRDEGQSSFTQVIDATIPPPAESMYLKQGLYRGGAVDGRVDVLWIGPTARGDSFDAVESLAFGTHVGP